MSEEQLLESVLINLFVFQWDLVATLAIPQCLFLSRMECIKCLQVAKLITVNPKVSPHFAHQTYHGRRVTRLWKFKKVLQTNRFISPEYFNLFNNSIKSKILVYIGLLEWRWQSSSYNWSWPYWWFSRFLWSRRQCYNCWNYKGIYNHIFVFEIYNNNTIKIIT